MRLPQHSVRAGRPQQRLMKREFPVYAKIVKLANVPMQ
jgi:hypothetical protein